MSKESYNCFTDEKTLSGKGWKHEGGEFSNVYFHLSDKCVEKQDPYFITSLVFCPTDLKGHLRPEHRECLSAASIKFKLLIN